MPAEGKSVYEGQARFEPGEVLLYRTAAVAALFTVVVTLTQIVIFGLKPPPDFQPNSGAVVAIFELLRGNSVLGFIELDGLMLVDYVLIAIVFIALAAALRRSQFFIALLGSTLGLVAITAYFGANPAFAMLALSNHYNGDVSTIAAGQAVLATFQGSGFLVHYILMGIAGVILSFAMWRGQVFSRTTAVAGFLQGAMMLVPSTLGTIGLVFALGSLAPFIVWFVLIAMRLLRLPAGAMFPG